MGSFPRFELTTKMIFGALIDKMTYVEINTIQKIYDYFINFKDNINIYDNKFIYIICYYLVSKLYKDYNYRLIDALIVFNYKLPIDKKFIADIEVDIFKTFNLNLYIKTPALYLAILRNTYNCKFDNSIFVDLFNYCEYFIILSLYLYQTIEYTDEEIIGTILYICKSLEIKIPNNIDSKILLNEIPKFIVNFDYLEQIINIHNENILKLNKIDGKLQYSEKIFVAHPLHFL
jgi:hypothetical protein